LLAGCVLLAEARGVDWLKSCLSPEQLADYDRTRSFVVIGGTSGHRYRICWGTSQNIIRLEGSADVREVAAERCHRGRGKMASSRHCWRAACFSLHEATPQEKRIGVFWNPTTPSHVPALKAVRAGAKMLGVKLYEAPTRRIEDYDGAIASILAENVNSLLVMASPISYSDNASHLIQLTLKHRLPAMFGYKENVQAGGR
jgi:ABC transporter substrate binding protein